jgi:hypothetical protein
MTCESCPESRPCAPSDRVCRASGSRSIPPACAHRAPPAWCPKLGGVPREGRLVALLRLACDELNGADHAGLRSAIWDELRQGQGSWDPTDGPDDADRGADPYGRTR